MKKVCKQCNGVGYVKGNKIYPDRKCDSCETRKILMKECIFTKLKIKEECFEACTYTLPCGIHICPQSHVEYLIAFRVYKEWFEQVKEKDFGIVNFIQWLNARRPRLTKEIIEKEIEDTSSKEHAVK